MNEKVFKYIKRKIKPYYDIGSNLGVKFIVWIKIKNHILPTRISKDYNFLSYLFQLGSETINSKKQDELKSMFLDSIKENLDNKNEIFSNMIHEYLKNSYPKLLTEYTILEKEEDMFKYIKALNKELNTNIQN